jgi:hypothetical protein
MQLVEVMLSLCGETNTVPHLSQRRFLRYLGVFDR